MWVENKYHLQIRAFGPGWQVNDMAFAECACFYVSHIGQA